jgi:hypothetical protein
LVGVKEKPAWSHDAWGNEIKYYIEDLNGKKHPGLRSFGSNGKDEDGNGDDIVVEIKIKVGED